MSAAGTESGRPERAPRGTPEPRARRTAPYHFAAGAGPLPGAVIERLREELAGEYGPGGSPLERSFTSQEFRLEAERTAASLARLLALPADYEVLFVHGGATAQFAAVPLNLLGQGGCADYLVTGYWSEKAAREAERFGRVRRVIHQDRDGGRIAAPADWRLGAGAAYVHIVSNETAEGRQFHEFPDTGAAALVADMSSDFLTRPIPAPRFGLIYASAQKNAGIAGFAVVIARRGLLREPAPGTPAVLDYGRLAREHSLLNTPATFAIRVAGLAAAWIEEQGGIAAMEQASLRKCGHVYRVLDAGGFYRCQVPTRERSRINVCFSLRTAELEAMFLSEAEAEGLRGLKGHPATGGIRVSLYNGMPERGAEVLADFLDDFARRFG